MSDKNVVILSDREHATILNALRFWQHAGHPAYPEIANDVPGGLIPEADVDAFCERICTEVDLNILLTFEEGYVKNAYVADNAARIAVNIFDLDVDGIDEQHLIDLPIPFIGIQTGQLYSVSETIAAPEFLDLLNKQIEEQDGASIDAPDAQDDLFSSSPSDLSTDRSPEDIVLATSLAD